MSKDRKYIKLEHIKQMLYGDEAFIKEFASAAVQSFNEFSSNFSNHLLNRDETNIRKAGHKIKPVAQMLNIPEILDEYEHGKTLLQENEPMDKLEQSAQNMTNIIDQILKELEEINEMYS